LAKVQAEKKIHLLQDRAWGGMPLITWSGDIMQLPPVGGKVHFDPGIPSSSKNVACAMGRQVVQDFLRPPAGSGARGVTFVMDTAVRQKDDRFLDLINRMRRGEMDQQAVQLIIDRRLDRLPPAVRDEFEEKALYIMPTWKRTAKITMQYLLTLGNPVARVDAVYDCGKTNHMNREKSLPERNALSIHAIVMLLKNFLVELGLKNGSLGKIVKIVYANKEGPTKDPRVHPAYVVVDFPNCTIPKEDALWKKNEPTLVPIPVAMLRCEKKCCSECSIPLRVAKAVSSYKSQGMTVGKGKLFEKAVIGLPVAGGKSTPGEEQMMISRAEEIADFAISDDEPITQEQLYKIGHGPANQMRLAFEQELKDLMATTAAPIERELTEESDGDFDKGFKLLVEKFNKHVEQFQV
jgi:hypothetical protein